MRYSVQVKAKTSREKVEVIRQGVLKVWVRAKPVEGAANKAVVRVLAEYFDVKPRCVRIQRGQTASRKIIDVDW